MVISEKYSKKKGIHPPVSVYYDKTKCLAINLYQDVFQETNVMICNIIMAP